MGEISKIGVMGEISQFYKGVMGEISKIGIMKKYPK
jgi:hypothetical protein